MIVKDLISRLQALPEELQNAKVVVNMSRNELANGQELGKITKVLATRHEGMSQWVTDLYPHLDIGENEERGVVVNLTS